MVNQNKTFSFRIKRQPTNVIAKNVERTIVNCDLTLPLKDRLINISGIWNDYHGNVLKTRLQLSCDNSSHLMRTDTPEDVVAMIHKRVNFCDFQFTSLHTNPLLKMGLLFKERISSPKGWGEQILSL